VLSSEAQKELRSNACEDQNWQEKVKEFKLHRAQVVTRAKSPGMSKLWLFAQPSFLFFYIFFFVVAGKAPCPRRL
jgi:hypothetical protein